MDRRAIARRYAPLALLAALQLVTVILMPSRAPDEQQLTAAPGTDQGIPQSPSGDDAGSQDQQSAPGPGGAPAGSVDSGSGPDTASGGSSGSPAGSGARTGDTSHCVAGRQFDPAIDFYAPPCVPEWGDRANGGATYQGVTETSVKLVEYVPKANEAFNAVAEQAGLYVPPEKIQAFRDAVQKFVNQHFELYGRRFQIKPVNGTCELIPPDIACLRNDFRRIIKDEKPYMIVWVVPGCSACFDEMSQLRTPNLGGLYFTDEFSQARAPYHWDVQPSGTFINRAIAQFWCTNLAKRPAAYALHVDGSMNGRPRKLGVIGPNDPQVQATVRAAKAELAKCGERISAEYYYAADFSTAAQQVQAGIAKMRQAQVTTIYYLSDIAGPGYFMGGQQLNNWFAENLMSGAGTQDNDDSGQELQNNPIACPEGPPCPFSQGFGLSLQRYEPVGRDAGTRVWRAAGSSGPPPYDRVTFAWDYYSLAATLMQAAGPALTPQNMDAGVRAYGLRGDATHVLRGFPAGSYTWGQDVGMLYWNKDEVSPYNGDKGRYHHVGARVRLGGFTPGSLGTLPRRG